MNEELETHFAPAYRLDNGEVYIQTIKVLGLRKVLNILEIFPNMIAILNKERQVLYANKAFAKAIGVESFEDGLGQRPGELFACVHSQDTKFGCGTGEACQRCGAVLTLLKAQETGQKEESDAVIVVNKNGEHIPLKLSVIASPIEIDNETFYIVIITEKNG